MAKGDEGGLFSQVKKYCTVMHGNVHAKRRQDVQEKVTY